MYGRGGTLTLAEVLDLEPVAFGQPRLLSGVADDSRTVRWAHVIGQDRPGHLLEGRELILSTLPRLAEDRPDLEDALTQYLSDLDDVGAAALAVEVLPDRPRVLGALEAAARRRDARPDAAELTPLLLFSRVVRFQQITEALHRELVAQELEADGFEPEGAPIWDPLVSAATNLFDDLAAPGGLPVKDMEDRVAALGMPRAARYVPLVVRLKGGAKETSSHRVAQLALCARQAAAQMRRPALVGAGKEAEFCVMLAVEEPSATFADAGRRAVETFCAALREDANRRRTYDLVPRYLVGVGEQMVPMGEAPEALADVSGIARSALRVIESSSRAEEGLADPAAKEWWGASDLGLAGLLVHTAEQPEAEWFARRYLPVFAGDDGQQLREVVRAAARTRGNKAELARELGLSRPTLYSRIGRIERLTGRPFDGEQLMLLYTALLLDDLKPRGQDSQPT
ncbi:helix-turn-helix domain-containing protein [Nesterenkonia haasae]|uniref:helix-turn-helix domain-containing protein n=1 Tax=Nesterenkonia haasae TaxID=2587813 RepID=UPI00139147FF|nr:PucR family transcriptional regulator ligand-binding domain-containing protein [Nesterenkonia haasae]NDK32493.1 hypothetical protein [Nesterenkonia haasae]